MITKISERRLMTEREIDKEYLRKIVLLDRTGVPSSHSGGYAVAYGDTTDEDSEALSDLGQQLFKGNFMIQVGLEERGLITFGL